MNAATPPGRSPATSPCSSCSCRRRTAPSGTPSPTRRLRDRADRGADRELGARAARDDRRTPDAAMTDRDEDHEREPAARSVGGRVLLHDSVEPRSRRII